MAENGKRLNKFLDKAGLKGKLRPVESLEEEHIIVIEDKQCLSRSKFMRKDEYKRLVENDRTFPSDIVHFLVSTNPRNGSHIEKKLISNRFGSIKFRYK